MPRPKKPKPLKINKRELLARFVDVPKTGIREFSMREFAVLKRIEEKYPLEFLNIINFGKKFASLLVLEGEWGKTELARKFHAYNYQPPTQEQIKLSPEKFGEDIEVAKKLSLRDLI